MNLAVGLPDLHPGKASPIGAAFLTSNLVYPNLVGNDIGCGIGLYRTNLDARAKRRASWADRLRGLDDAWDGSAADYLHQRGIAPTAHDASLGTIGGGNHFAEFQTVEQILDPEVAASAGIDASRMHLCVHSGSRGFGAAILSSHLERFGAAGLEAGSLELDRYLESHNHALAWARANRDLISRRMLDAVEAEGYPLADTTHNWVERTPAGWLHRKGAAPATADLVIIPGSRGAFTYVVAPIEPREESAWSLAHGAGRKWTRTDSRGRLADRFTARQLERTELGSTVICEDRDLLYEEAPQAYKNITTVIDDLVAAGLMRVVAILRPVLTYKVRR